MTRKIAFAALMTATLAVSTAFAHDHMGEGKKEAMSCPHHQAVQASLDKAAALLDQVATVDAAKKDALAAQARQELKNAEEQMEQCRQMCSTMHGKMEDHDHAAMMGGQEGHHGAHHAAGNAATTEEKEIDPVCGMKVARNNDLKSVYAGKAYYFCSKEDKVAFDKDPEAYLKKKP